MRFELYFKLFKIILLIIGSVRSTIDMNVSQFEYLASHMHNEECRKLLAVLHFKTYELPNALDQAERRVARDEPCLTLLLHWNTENGGGKGESHEFVARRLRQLGRHDLADWLTKSSNAAIGHDITRLLNDTFKQNIATHPSNPDKRAGVVPQPLKKNQPAVAGAVAPIDRFANRRIAKQDFAPTVATDIASDPTEWTIFDTISWSVVILLFLIIIVLMVYLTLALSCCKQKRKCQKCCRSHSQMHYCGSRCPNSPCANPSCRRSYTKMPRHAGSARMSEEEHEVREQNRAALELMGVEMPQYTKQKTTSYTRICNCKHKGNQYEQPHGFTKTTSQYEMQCPCPKHNSPCSNPYCGAAGGAVISGGSGALSPMLKRTIDIHQKIAIPMSHTSS